MLAKTESLTPRAVAAVVPKSAALRAIESEFAEARQAYDAIVTEQRALIAKNGLHNYDREIMNLEGRLEPARKRVDEIRAKFIPLQQQHGDAIAKSLADIRRESAARIAELIEELRVPFDIMSETQTVIEANGGSCIRFPLPWLNDVDHLARRIAGLLKAPVGVAPDEE